MLSDSTQTILIVIAVVIIGFLVMNYLNGNDIQAEQDYVNENFSVPSYETFQDEPQLPPVLQQAAAQQAAAQQAAAQQVAAQQVAAQQGAAQQGAAQQGARQVQAAQQATDSNPASVQQQSARANQLPSECYPGNNLKPEELLPGSSSFASASPDGPGSLTDKNFLNAGFHIGINTVGQSLRNANRQLRSDPPNPQVKVSPWMQTTIEPDVNRKPMEIGQ